MKINEEDLDGFASALVDQCMATRRERVQMYNGLYHYYLFGAPDGSQSPYGKIYPHIDLLYAYLYSQATVEFAVGVQNVPEAVFKQAELIGRRSNVYFHEHGVADIFGEALKLSFVWGTTLLKMNNRSRPFKLEPYLIEPHNFGVLNEGVNLLRRQEAFCEAYTIGRDELRRRVSVLPNAEDIMRRIQASPVTDEEAYPESIHRIIVAGPSAMTSGTTRGVVNMPELFNQLKYKPEQVDDQVQMYELNVWDDDREDYRTITLAAPGVVIYGRKDIGNLFGIKGMHPYVHICPNRLHNYFYGWSEVTNLIRLQDWLSERLREIRRIMSLQADPPRAFAGFGGINDEKMAAFNTPGAYIGEQNPGAKVETLAPELPSGLFEEVYAIQGFYNDISGLSDILQGRGETGVRSMAQTSTLAKFGSARIKQRAQVIEQSLEDVGGLIVSLMRKKDEHRYTMGENEKFIASQFSDDYQVNVDAHSMSPVFADDHKQLAMALLKFGAIDKQSALELMKPPKLELLKQRLLDTERARAAQMQQMLAAGMVPGKKGLKAV
jgi:hypothetical protein